MTKRQIIPLVVLALAIGSLFAVQALRPQTEQVASSDTKVETVKQETPVTNTNINTNQANANTTAQQPKPVPQTIPWKLVSGDVTDTCTNPTFTGQAVLKGWYVYDSNYVEKDWQLRISVPELSKLPVNQLYNGNESLKKHYEARPVFMLENASPELVARLKKATAQNPTEVVVTKFNQYCEGSAVLAVKE